MSQIQWCLMMAWFPVICSILTKGKVSVCFMVVSAGYILMSFAIVIES